MKRMLVLFALAGLVLPAAALAKGPSAATITGPGLAKPITLTGTEGDASPMMTLTDQAGFFPAAYGQEPNPMLPGRPKGALGPSYRIDYTVPQGGPVASHISQDLYPYASPAAITYMPAGQKIFDTTTRGGWYSSPQLKATLVAAGLPERAGPTAHTSSSASFFSTGRIGLLALVLVLLGAGTVAIRRRTRGRPAA